jgi:phosphohistidine phosphatase
MKTLLVLRHAKSDWDDLTIDDHERPLNERGVKSAARMGRLMRDLDMQPQHCICSTATRSRDTYTLALETLGQDLPVEYLKSLYTFGEGDDLEAAIAAHDGNAERLLVIAHNPAIQGFVLHTCDGGDVFGLGQIRMKYPTAGLSRIEYEMDSWADLPSTKGKLTGFWRPRDIM